MMARTNVAVVGDSATNTTVCGTLTEVRRWVFSLGLSIGAERYKQESCSGGIAIHDTTVITGYDLADVDGMYAGLMLRGDGDWSATVRSDLVNAA